MSSANSAPAVLSAPEEAVPSPADRETPSAVPCFGFGIGLAVAPLLALGCKMMGALSSYNDYILAVWFSVVFEFRWWLLLPIAWFAVWHGGPSSPLQRAFFLFGVGTLVSGAFYFGWWYWAPAFVAVLVGITLALLLCYYWPRLFLLQLATGLLLAGFVFSQYVGIFDEFLLDRRVGLGWPGPLAATAALTAAGVLVALICLYLASRRGALLDYRLRLVELIVQEPRMTSYFALVRRLTRSGPSEDHFKTADLAFPVALIPAFQNGTAPADPPSSPAPPTAEPRKPAIGVTGLVAGLRDKGEKRMEWLRAWTFASARASAAQKEVARQIAQFRPARQGVPFPSNAVRELLAEQCCETRNDWSRCELTRLRAETGSNADLKDAESPHHLECRELIRRIRYEEALAEATCYFLHPERETVLNATLSTFAAAEKEFQGKRRMPSPGNAGLPRTEDERAWWLAASRYEALWGELMVYQLLSWPKPAGPSSAPEFPVDCGILLTTWRKLLTGCWNTLADEPCRAALDLAFTVLAEATAKVPGTAKSSLPSAADRRDEKTLAALHQLAAFLNDRAALLSSASPPVVRSARTGNVLWSVETVLALVATSYLLLGEPLRALRAIRNFEAHVMERADLLLCRISAAMFVRYAAEIARRPESVADEHVVRQAFGSYQKLRRRVVALVGPEAGPLDDEERWQRRFLRTVTPPPPPAAGPLAR